MKPKAYTLPEVVVGKAEYVKLSGAFRDICRNNGKTILYREGLADFYINIKTGKAKRRVRACRQYELPTLRRAPIVSAPPRMPRPERAISPREALLAAAEKVPLPRCLGRISAASAIGCPPAIPIVIMGERINSAAIACLEYYGIESCMVVK